MSKDLIILGTRPEIIKFAPLIKSDIDFDVLFTGQHTDLAEEAFDIFDIEPKYSRTRNSGSIDKFISDFIQDLNFVFSPDEYERIWVQGDTASTYAGALYGYLNDIPVIHLEAGLRTYDLKQPYPEEGFRQMISRIASVNLCPTESAAKNLRNERVPGEIHVVGNTIVDALNMIDLPKERVMEDDFALVTMHRREAIGEPMKNCFKAMKEISKDIKIVFPCHPNPAVRKLAKESGVDIIEPLNYKDMLHHIRDAKFIMTDSGGIQEEAPSFNTPVLVLRNTTERPELIDSGLGELVGYDTDKIVRKAKQCIDSKGFTTIDNPFGDGKTVEAIKNIFNL